MYTAWPHVIMIAPWGLPSERFCGIEAEVIVLGGLWMTPIAAMSIPIKNDGVIHVLTGNIPGWHWLNNSTIFSCNIDDDHS